MQGNVNEWCQDAVLFCRTDLARMGDKEQTGKLDNSRLRVLRGGAFENKGLNARSPRRNSNQPANRNNDESGSDICEFVYSGNLTIRTRCALVDSITR